MFGSRRIPQPPEGGVAPSLTSRPSPGRRRVMPLGLSENGGCTPKFRRNIYIYIYTCKSHIHRHCLQIHIYICIYIYRVCRYWESNNIFSLTHLDSSKYSLYVLPTLKSIKYVWLHWYVNSVYIYTVLFSVRCLKDLTELRSAVSKLVKS